MPEGTEVAETETETTTTSSGPTAEVEKWKALARKHETRAKENADKAKRFDDLEEKNKSELDKATARAEAAEKALAASTLASDRLTVALAKGLDPELAPLLSGATKDEIEASAELLAKHSTRPAPKATGQLKSGATGAAGEVDGKAEAAAALRLMRGVG